MPSEFRMKHRIEFSMTDMAGIMHFPNAFRLMEVTEHAFFRSLGGSIVMPDGERKIGWPRVHVECDYKAPLLFEEEVEVELRIREKRSRALTYDFFIWKIASEPPTLAAKGSMTAVCVSMDKTTGKMKATDIPAYIASQIEVAETTETEI
ncbi:MAG: acyl-CoA thioesterase [Armatimonadetes bacterium]|nr:acyl-CoA thioesterase [Armatimonadota bacterium]